MRELLLDRVILEHVLVWLISSVVYAIMAAWYAAKQFKRGRFGRITILIVMFYADFHILPSPKNKYENNSNYY